MRVLVVSMWPSAASPERGIFVERQVAALRAAGVEVDVAPLTDARTGRVRALAKYARLAREARRQIRSHRPDLVHGHFLLPTGVVAASVARHAGLPYVVTAHGTDVRNAEQSERIRARTERVVRGAAAVIAVSESLATRIRLLYPGVEPTIVDMGVDTSVYRPRDMGTRAVATPGEPRIVAVGSLLANKNHITLVRAFAALTGGTLTIVGEGPERERIEAATRDLGVEDRVSLPGRVPAEWLARLYAESDVATLVSHDEGFGLAALEALASGVPVVVSASAPVSQLVEPHVTGEVVRPDDPAGIAVALGRAATYRVTPEQAAAAVRGRSTADRAAELALVYGAVVDSGSA